MRTCNYCSQEIKVGDEVVTTSVLNLAVAVITENGSAPMPGFAMAGGSPTQDRDSQLPHKSCLLQRLGEFGYKDMPTITPRRMY